MAQTRLPTEDTEIKYCYLCRAYHGYERRCPWTLARKCGSAILMAFAYAGVAYTILIEWWVKIMLLVIISALIYITIATFTGWPWPGEAGWPWSFPRSQPKVIEPSPLAGMTAAEVEALRESVKRRFPRMSPKDIEQTVEHEAKLSKMTPEERKAYIDKMNWIRSW